MIQHDRGAKCVYMWDVLNPSKDGFYVVYMSCVYIYISYKSSKAVLTYAIVHKTDSGLKAHDSLGSY